MMKRVLLGCIVLLVTSCWLYFPVPGWAQETQSPQGDDAAAQQEEQPPVAPGREELGTWWLYSSKKIEPIYPLWLFHIEANYALLKQTGNTEGSTQEGKLYLALRKNIATNYVNANLSIIDTTDPDGDTDTEDIDFSNSLQLDLTSRVYARLGVSWERDTAAYIDSRWIYYGGFGVNVIETAKHVLSLKAYYGYDSIEYTELGKEAALLLGVEIEKETSDGLLLEQGFQWMLTERITLQELFGYFRYFEDSDKYRWALNLGVTAQVWGPLGVYSNYQIDYDASTTAEIIQGYEKRDTSFTIGLSVTF